MVSYERISRKLAQLVSSGAEPTEAVVNAAKEAGLDSCGVARVIEELNKKLFKIFYEETSEFPTASLEEALVMLGMNAESCVNLRLTREKMEEDIMEDQVKVAYVHNGTKSYKTDTDPFEEMFKEASAKEDPRVFRNKMDELVKQASFIRNKVRQAKDDLSYVKTAAREKFAKVLRFVEDSLQWGVGFDELEKTAAAAFGEENTAPVMDAVWSSIEGTPLVGNLIPGLIKRASELPSMDKDNSSIPHVFTDSLRSLVKLADERNQLVSQIDKAVENLKKIRVESQTL